MLYDELLKKHDHLVSRVTAMLTAQQDYFDGAKRGYKEPAKLTKAKALENEVIKLIKQENIDKSARQTALF